MLSVSYNYVLHHTRFTVNYRKQNPSWTIWHCPALFPLLNSPARQTEVPGKFSLRQAQLLSDALYVRQWRIMDQTKFCPPRQFRCGIRISGDPPRDVLVGC